MVNKKIWSITIIAFMSVIVSWFIYEYENEPVIHNVGTVTKEPNTNYEIELLMEESGVFQISAAVRITNDSEDNWSEIGFYLVPNAMNSDDAAGYSDEAAELEIITITAGENEVDHQLNNNELLVQLDSDMHPGEVRKVNVEYTLTVPENGMRLSQVDNNFYLAHWYPMLARYEDGWQINDYDPKGESYETGYGNYTFNYEFPSEYFVATSAQDGAVETKSSGTVEGGTIKDFYAAFLDPADWEVAGRRVGDTELRVFVPADSEILEETADLAVKAYTYFEENIGDHPFAELDFIANDGYMEYPNIVEVPAEEELLDSILVHEIAHQWFYYVVSNDPYEDAWLDESLTEFSTALFLDDYYGEAGIGFQTAAAYEASYRTETYANLTLHEFERPAYYSTVYGKVPLLLKEFFDAKGGNEAALEFLSDYYEEFRFQRVTEEEFRDFFDDYFDGDQQAFLDSWLQ